MKVLLTVGSPYSGHELVFERLGQIGVADALACRGENLTPRAIHELMLRSYEISLDGEGPLEQLQPGKLWNELAADLLLANINQPLWGWADDGSAFLLDFWREFDPQVRFLLVYDTPHAYLAKALAGQARPTAELVNSALGQWARWNTALLRYFHRHPSRCVLVNSQHALQQTQSLTTVLTEQWQIRGFSELPDHPETRGTSHQALQTYLSRQLIDESHPVWALHQELECSAQLPSVSASTTDDAPCSAWGDWVGVRKELSDGLMRQTRIDEFQNINQSLVRQVHQTQAELETLFLENHALGQAANQLENLQAELLYLRSLAGQWASEKAELACVRDVQLALTAEYEAAHRATTETLQTRQAAWAEEKAKLIQAHDAQAKLTSECKLTLETLQAEKTRTALQLEQLQSQHLQNPQGKVDTTELQQENELLLLQLHQVQEELEHYFLKCQELDHQKNTRATSFVTDFWRLHQPQELHIDMRQDVAGSNWYPAELDGRWAGPASVSTIELPPLQAGQYRFELDVESAMDPEIVTSLKLEAFGKNWPLQVEHPLSGHKYPLTCTAIIEVSCDAPVEPWPVSLKFSKLFSPADSGSDDQRQLALRLRTLRIAKLSG